MNPHSKPHCTVIFELSLFFFITLFAFVARLSSFEPPAIWEVCFYAMLRSFYALFSYGNKLYAFRSPIVGDHGGYLISLVLNALSTSRRERGSKAIIIEFTVYSRVRSIFYDSIIVPSMDILPRRGDGLGLHAVR